MFFVESEEEFALCPNCGSPLVYHSRVTRTVIDSAGTKSVYSIRVLKCGNQACPTRYHRELPNTIIPYRRYDAESIEEVIEQGNTGATVAADESTIRRWRNWFAGNARYIMMALLSAAAVIEQHVETSSLTIQTDRPEEAIKGIVGRRIKWLGETVRILVNSAKWIFNRSAFLTG